MKLVEFIKREILDTETGEVFNSVGKDRTQMRLYNAPWIIVLMAEIYNLTNEEEYVEILYRVAKHYYSLGGEKFYPNGIHVKDIIEAVNKSGKKHYVKELITMFERHTQNMIDTGLNYPPHEVDFEQTIVTPAVAFMCEMGLVSGDEKYLNSVKNHIKVLDRFNGYQPDYHMNGIPIRYWDDFWFGKSTLYADVYPHYWSCLTASSWHVFGLLSQNEEYIKKAENCIRNCLCLFHEDGSASNSYVYPFSVDGNKGEFYDDWANDQDFALYFAMQILLEN